MINIATLTFHRVMNCGAVLQAYALQHYCSKFANTQILDYRCDYLEKKYGYKKTIIRRIKNFIKIIIRDKEYLLIAQRRKKFTTFYQKYLVTSKMYTPKNVKDSVIKFDGFIAGSDQIWNPKWSGEDWNYFLEFAPSEKRYSYAASFGAKEVRESYYNRALSNLSLFQKLLIREKQGLTIVNDMDISTEPQLVCDPVFLFSKEEWEKQFNLQKSNDKFIFVYFTGSPTNAVPFIKKLSAKTGLKVIYFNSFSLVNVDDSFENMTNVGPLDFLNYIFNAEYVVSTSFHAIAFSILFNTKFFYELNKNGDNDNSRVESIIDEIGIPNCEIKNGDLFETKWNWNEINNKISLYANSSQELLMNMLFQIRDR